MAGKVHRVTVEDHPYRVVRLDHLVTSHGSSLSASPRPQPGPTAASTPPPALRWSPRVCLLDEAVLLELSACERLWGGRSVLHQLISEQKEGVVFLLWGNFAKGKKALIDQTKHYVLEAAHPSPLAGDAFKGCRHFSHTNEILEKQGKEPIDWRVSG